MTLTERKRAGKLRKIFESCGSYGRMKVLLALSLLLTVVAGSLILIFAAKDDELFMTVPFVCFMMFFSWVLSSIPAMSVGDTGQRDIGTASGIGTSLSGKFLCTLPFKASDMLNMRLLNWEDTAAAGAVLISAAQIASMIAESRGYTILHGTAGAAVLYAVFMEILVMIVTVNRNNIVQIVIGLTLGCSYAFYMGMIFGTADNHDSAAELSESLSGLEVLYGASGIILYIAATVIIAAIGELCVKKMKNVSWHLK